MNSYQTQKTRTKRQTRNKMMPKRLKSCIVFGIEDIYLKNFIDLFDQYLNLLPYTLSFTL